MKSMGRFLIIGEADILPDLRRSLVEQLTQYSWETLTREEVDSIEGYDFVLVRWRGDDDWRNFAEGNLCEAKVPVYAILLDGDPAEWRSSVESMAAGGIWPIQAESIASINASDVEFNIGQRLPRVLEPFRLVFDEIYVMLAIGGESGSLDIGESILHDFHQRVKDAKDESLRVVASYKTSLRESLNLAITVAWCWVAHKKKLGIGKQWLGIGPELDSYVAVGPKRLEAILFLLLHNLLLPESPSCADFINNVKVTNGEPAHVIIRMHAKLGPPFDTEDMIENLKQAIRLMDCELSITEPGLSLMLPIV